MNHLSLSFYKPGSVSFMKMEIFKGYLLDTHVHHYVHNKPLGPKAYLKSCTAFVTFNDVYFSMLKSYINLQKEARRMFFGFKLFFG